MTDEFDHYGTQLESPAEMGFSITPDDANDLDRPARFINVASTGTVRATLTAMEDGTTVDLFVAAGVPFPARIKRLWATGTTATGIVGLR